MCCCPLLVALAVSTAGAAAQQAARTRQISDKDAQAIREHIDDAENIVERLLDWRHAHSAVRPDASDVPPPAMPATTLIAVSRSEVERLTALLEAAASMLPETDQATLPRGDLHAHIQKAQEIARELMPGPAGKPVVTSGVGKGDKIEVDRTALQRLDLEIDPMELVAPRPVVSNRRMTPATITRRSG